MSVSIERVRTSAVWLPFLLLAWTPCAFALNPALDMSQYAHTAWRIREGFTRGIIRAIAQTADGYLWLGTEFGLLRFDGVSNVAWQPPPKQELPSTSIWSLLAARDGTLWIGTANGLASWKDGRLTIYPQLARQYVFRLIEDHEGSVWAGTIGAPSGRLCAIKSGSVRCFGEDGRLGVAVLGLYEDRHGSLWVGVDNGLWRWTPGPPELHPLPGESDAIKAFAEDDDGAVLFSARNGIRTLVNDRASVYPLPDSVRAFQADRLLRDRDGGFWIGTRNEGLLHVHHGRVDAFSVSDGLSGTWVYGLFEDREGNIWVSTDGGLDRFREIGVPTITARQGLSNNDVGSVLAARDGTIWLATNDGLNRWDKGRIVAYGTRNATFNGHSPKSLYQDRRDRIWISTFSQFGYLEKDRYIVVNGIPGGTVHAIAEDNKGDLWIANQELGLFRLSARTEVERFPWSQMGHRDHATALAVDPVHGGLWIGFFNGGIVYFDDGQVRASYASGADGLGESRINGFAFDLETTLWVATASGLSRLKDGRVATLTSRNGLPCDGVHWLTKDNDESVWLYTPCGLIRTPESELKAWAAKVDGGGDPGRLMKAAVFDNSDGVRSRDQPGGYVPLVSKSSDGNLWFVTLGGVSIVDPRHLAFNKLLPPVHIEQVIADRKTYDPAFTGMRLPALTRVLEIDYTALSLVAPEKNQFRIKLEGRDQDWEDVGTRRRKSYNDLPPRTYRFRVIASNNSGVWNEAGDSLEFSIAPAYYQTKWFRTAAAIMALTLLCAAYQFRVRQVAYAFEARLQERVNERTRIARDLHDTLLQSFHGLLFRLQASANMLPARPDDAKQNLERAIDQAAQAITEGRDAVQNLRSSTVVTNDLAVALSTLGEELATQARETKTMPAVVDVVVEGASRELHPILRDDIFRIAGEALRNAFRHAHARRIEVRIHYDDRQLQVRVRDDGKGLDRSALEEERPGHFGLRGMRERAELIGGHIEVWSEAGLGTEVDLKIPAAAAYATSGARGRLRSWFAKSTGTSS